MRMIRFKSEIRMSTNICSKQDISITITMKASHRRSQQQTDKIQCRKRPFVRNLNWSSIIKTSLKRTAIMPWKIVSWISIHRPHSQTSKTGTAVLEKAWQWSLMIQEVEGCNLTHRRKITIVSRIIAPCQDCPEWARLSHHSLQSHQRTQAANSSVNQVINVHHNDLTQEVNLRNSV